MKHLKRTGLVAVVAMALAGVGGAGTASATELCTVLPAGACPAGSLHGTGSVLEMTTTQWTLTAGGLGNITCSHSLVKGKTTSNGGALKNVDATIESFTTTGTEANGDCTLDTAGAESDPCTVTAINLPWTAVIQKSAQPDGTITYSNSGKGEPSFTAKCPATNTLCIFSAANMVLDWDGGKPALVTASKEPLTPSAEKPGACPAVGSWDATYTVLKPSPAYLVN